ncbi:hypothetical protein VYU27_010094, partial [Nannochloropsis oceanica]
ASLLQASRASLLQALGEKKIETQRLVVLLATRESEQQELQRQLNSALEGWHTERGRREQLEEEVASMFRDKEEEQARRRARELETSRLKRERALFESQLAEATKEKEAKKEERREEKRRIDSLRNELQALMEESEDFMPLLVQEGAHAR